MLIVVVLLIIRIGYFSAENRRREEERAIQRENNLIKQREREIEQAKQQNKKGLEHWSCHEYNDAFQYFRSSYNFGNEDAKYNLALCYYYGYGVAKNYKKAFTLFMGVTGECQPKAFLYLGRSFYFGLGTYVDYSSAVNYFNKAIAAGNTTASYYLALCYLDGNGVAQDIQNAISILQSLAYTGDRMSMAKLGMIYNIKQYGVQNYSLAYEWYTKAAEAGDIQSPLRIAWLYEYGRGVGKDLETAKSWYDKALEREAIGISYYYGKFLITHNLDIDKGFDLLNNAILNNDPKAMVFMGECLTNGNRIEIDYNKAFELFETAASLGDSDANAELAQAYYFGRGTDENIEKAAELCKQAIKENNNLARFILAQIFYWSNNTYGTVDEAISLLTDAAMNSYIPAQILLGDWYGPNGHNSKTDLYEQRKWYKIAAASGDAEGEFSLGDLYISSAYIFVPVDNYLFDEPIDDKFEKNLSEKGFELIMSAEKKAIVDNNRSLLYRIAQSLCWHYMERRNEQFDFTDEYEKIRDERFEHGMYLFRRYVDLDTIPFPAEYEKFKKHHEELFQKYLPVSLDSLTKLSSQWDCLRLRKTLNEIPYKCIVDYHPTSVNYISEKIKEERQLIWDFKEGDTIAMKKVEEHVREILEDQFKHLTRYLTLVCIPASSSKTNDRRYRDFAALLCQQCEMSNSFDHIRIIQDADEAKHMGGTEPAKIEFDKEFFYGKNVILFDDVVTSGRSMFKMKRKLADLGACTIAAISIGKTTHTRPEDAVDLTEDDDFKY